MFGCHYPTLCKEVNRIIKKTEKDDKFTCQFYSKDDPTKGEGVMTSIEDNVADKEK